MLIGGSADYFLIASLLGETHGLRGGLAVMEKNCPFGYTAEYGVAWCRYNPI
jgi:hypothetical protein